MPNYLFIHPFISAAAIALILIAYSMKAGSRKRQMPHYIAGAAAAVLLTTTVIVGLWAAAHSEVVIARVDA
ncbi:MAG: hypothetical protein GYB64_12595 [Chloroflexi bacterium]|nr:hypothetical protein [Chloroflexota bacterium]